MSPYDFTNVLVPVDGSDGSEKALDCALSICHALGAQLTALAVEGKLPGLVALLVVVALLANDAGGAGGAVAVAALGYAVGLTAHLALVLIGWVSRSHRRREPDGR
jgi:nucleotide-binding universal stress UspA family protein